MIILGNEHIPYEAIETTSNIDKIKNSLPNSTMLFSYDIGIMKYCNINRVAFAVVCKTIKQSVFANSLGAKYIILHENEKEIQKIAENYMFDAKILKVIAEDEEIEKIALDGIDGVLYKSILEGIN